MLPNIVIRLFRESIQHRRNPTRPPSSRACRRHPIGTLGVDRTYARTAHAAEPRHRHLPISRTSRPTPVPERRWTPPAPSRSAVQPNSTGAGPAFGRVPAAEGVSANARPCEQRDWLDHRGVAPCSSLPAIIGARRGCLLRRECPFRTGFPCRPVSSKRSNSPMVVGGVGR